MTTHRSVDASDISGSPGVAGVEFRGRGTDRHPPGYCPGADSDATYENESLRKFLAGEPDDLPWMQSWLDMLRKTTAEGRRFARVRLVALPLTDYSRFGVWCAQFTNGAGEDIRYLLRDKTEAAWLPNHDYWLFDSSKLVRMHFDDAACFLGGEVIEEPAEIVRANYWRDAAWHYAVRRDDFATEQHLGRV